MARNKLRMVVEAEVQKALKDFDKVSTKIKKSSESSKDFSKSLSSITKGLVGIAAGAVTFGAVAKAVSDCTSAYQTQLEAELKLQSALKATKGAVGLTEKELLNYATELSRLTGITDESLTAAQAVMLTFTQVGKDVFPEAIARAADMSAIFGNDLQSSVVQLGKALNDPIKGYSALQETGISFSDSQKEQIRTLQEAGDLMGAQKVILNELNAEFGGVAETIGGDTIGSVDRLTNAFTTLKEEQGRQLLEGGKPFIEWLTSLIEKSADAKKHLNDLKEAYRITDGKEAAQSDREYLDALTTVYEDYNKRISDIRANIEQLKKEGFREGDQGVETQRQLISQLQQEQKTYEAQINSISRKISAQEYEQTQIEEQAKAEQTLAEAKKLDQAEYRKWIDENYKKTSQYNDELIQQAYERAKANYEAANVGDWDYSEIKAIYEYYDSILNKKEEINDTPADETLNEYADKLKSVESELNRIAQERLNTTGAERAYYDQRIEALSEEYNELQGIQDELSAYEKQVNKITDAWDKAKSVMSDFSGVTSAIGGVYSEWTKLQDAEFRKYEQQMQARIDAAQEAADTQIEILREQYSSQYEALEENLDNDIISREEYLARKEELETEQKAKEAEARAVEEALQAELKKKQNEEGRKQFKVEQAQKIASATMSGAAATVEALTLGPFLGVAMASVIAGMTAAQIGIIGSQEYVPFAKGGIVTGPTNALIGEAGTEMVLPLSKAEEMGFGGSGQTINYVININGNAYGVKDIETHVFNGIQRAQKMNNLPKWSYVA